MYLLIVFLPLLGSLIAGLFGRYIGFKGSAIITCMTVLSSFVLSLIVFYEVALSGSCVYIKLSPWFFSEMFDASWGFLFDTITAVMLIVVCFVSSLVHIYSISYMWSDNHLPRFMSYLSIFTFFMLTLVTADNFIQMFFGWEGVGVCSYLLISFWFTRLQASKSSIKAMVMNRIGDFGLALGIMGIFFVFKTVDFAVVFALASYVSSNTLIFCNLNFNAVNVICILLFIGAVGKSAQLPLHTWLPDAMEGPTPVSALIHAATMVTAGVFMIARLSPLFEFAENALIIVSLVGAATGFFAATTGIVQNDLKKVIAYSTCSQLGYMIFASGISNYTAGVFHLMNHAFFKALLFLTAGSVIHAIGDIQDMRKMGGMTQILPVTYSMMLIGSFSLVGFPFLTGFYSKDLILELAFAKYTFAGNFAYFLGIICVLFTSYYSFRLVFLSFLSNSTTYKNSIRQAHESEPIMLIPLILLAFGSIFVGYLFKDMMVGLGSDFWGNSIFILPKNILLVESEYIPQTQKFIPLFFIFLGFLLSLVINHYSHYSAFFKKNAQKVYMFKKAPLGNSLYYMFNKRWFFDKVYNDFIAQTFMQFGYTISFKTLDKGCFEIIGPFGISSFFKMFTYHISKLQTGMIYHYAVIMLIFLTLLITVISLSNTLELFAYSKYYCIYITSFLFYNYYS